VSGRRPLPIAVLLSGEGTNLQAILDAIREGRLDAEVRLVVSSRPDAGGLRRAQRAGVPARVIRSVDFPTVGAFRQALLEALRASGAELVVLAGYLKKVPRLVLEAFPDRVINLHPALLPRHGGKGFYGRRVHEAVLASGDKVSGATVHLVTEAYDRGPILMQEEVPVLPGDTPETLAERIHEVEHRILPAVIQAFAEGRVRREGDRVWLEDAPA
jgi:phosphoribosylglycinamide formyltransferase-1